MMRQLGAKEIPVQSNQRGLWQPVEQRDEILVLGSGIPKFLADGPAASPPPMQQEPLLGGQIFVEHQHEIP